MSDLSPAQAMARLNLPRSTFWRWVWQGVSAGVLVVRKYGRTYRLDAASFEAWSERNRVTSVADLRRLADGRRTA